MDLEQALQTFFAESRELLQSMEESLLRLEADPLDADAINSVFRAAHTIKGSAGLFNLDHIVSFTHVVENLLDRVRSGEIGIDSDLIALLLSCRDHIENLLDIPQDGKVGPEIAALTQKLLDALRSRLVTNQAAPPASAQKAAPQVCDDGPMVGNGHWHISLRPGKEVLKDGMDPLSFIGYLRKLGEIVSITTIYDALLNGGEFDPECLYLGFEIDFSSNAEKSAIEDVFQFLQSDSIIRILPPHGRISDYVELIETAPEGKERIGELLVQSGAITQKELAEMLGRQHAPGKTVPLGEMLVQEHVVQQDLVDAALDKQKRVRESKSQESKYLRVQADKLDQLINLVGELVIAGASANMLAQQSGNSVLQESLSLMSRLVEEIRGSALRLRMVQINETFSRFQRIVRDLSHELGKEIDLVVSGAETELDKTMVEKIGDPLVHLVRNAIDHGIEPTEVRTSRGKPAKGTVRLNAYHDSGSVVIEVGDDGGGMPREKIVKKAMERGLVTPGQNLSDKEIFNLIFEPGFSTADHITNLSGRGVGLDVVRRNIDALRGSVEVESEDGQGSDISIRLPLTLAIIDGFLVKVGLYSYVVPLDMVLECVEMADSDRACEGDRCYINLRGEVLPFLNLRTAFEVECDAPPRQNIVVVQHGGQKSGLVVDELLGEFQTVIKPLGNIFRNLRGVSGSTILGNGEVALILDVPVLVDLAARSEARSLDRVREPELLAN